MHTVYIQVVIGVAQVEYKPVADETIGFELTVKSVKIEIK